MRVIGVTGGVGAGKSTVLSYLKEKCGARLIFADEVGHQVMEPGMAAYRQVLERFGKEILGSGGRIDRKTLGNLVFSDEKERLALNAIIHPAVKARILEELEAARRQEERYAVVEAALFLEENYDRFCDDTWYIFAEEKIRRERLKKSRGYTDERVSQIMARQRSHEEFLARCKYMIDNSGTPEETACQIDRRLRKMEEYGRLQTGGQEANR